MEARFVPERGANGVVRSVLAIMRDITERRRAEEDLRKVQAELAHVARVTTMGELAASIAHEVNQPIGGVLTNGNACLRWLAKVEGPRSTSLKRVRPSGASFTTESGPATSSSAFGLCSRRRKRRRNGLI